MCSFFCINIDNILNLPVPLYKGLLPCLPKLLTCGASDYIQSQLCGNSASLARNSFLPGPSDMPRAAFQIRVALFQPPRVLCWWGFPETAEFMSTDNVLPEGHGHLCTVGLWWSLSLLWAPLQIGSLQGQSDKWVKSVLLSVVCTVPKIHKA